MTAAQTINELYSERECTPWYWRAVATLSAALILLGFLFFPLSFPTSSTTTFSQSALSIVAVGLLAVGYSLSVAAWFLCRSWLFQLDVLFVPCLSSCVLGALNVILTLSLGHITTLWTPATISALALAIASALVYAVLSILVHHKVTRVRSRGVPTDYSVANQYVDLEHLQRKASASLLSPSMAQFPHSCRSTTFSAETPDSVQLGGRSGSESSSSLCRSPASTQPSFVSQIRQQPTEPEQRDARGNASPLAEALKSARERSSFRKQQAREGVSPMSLYNAPVSEKPASESLGHRRHTTHSNYTVDTSSTLWQRTPEELDARMALPRNSMAGSIQSPLSPT